MGPTFPIRPGPTFPIRPGPTLQLCIGLLVTRTTALFNMTLIQDTSNDLCALLLCQILMNHSIFIHYTPIFRMVVMPIIITYYYVNAVFCIPV